nr:MAG TPA: hypothetical protein [Caudoviricetes sp.]
MISIRDSCVYQRVKWCMYHGYTPCHIRRQKMV